MKGVIGYMTDNEYDQEIRKIAQREEYPCPDDFSERMKTVYYSLSDSRIKRWLLQKKETMAVKHVPCFRYGLVAAAMACLLLTITPVSANLQGYWRRMAEMGDEEKARYVSGLEQFNGAADTYSRELTGAEWERKRILSEAYEQGKSVPVGAVVYVTGKEELAEGQVGFCARNSTFYVPDSSLTDEQLLEIIDFQYKRQYSLAEKGGEATEAPEEGGKDRAGERKEAAAAGEEWIRRIYGKSVAGWESTIKRADSADGIMYAVTYRDQETEEEYTALVDKGDGDLIQLNCDYNGKADNMTKGLPVVSKKAIRNRYRELQGLAKQVKDSGEIVSARCTYLEDQETDTLLIGTVNFWLFYDDGSAMSVRYSLNSQEYYQFDLIKENGEERYKDYCGNTSSSAGRRVIRLQRQKKRS